MAKKCSRCQEIKDESEFSKRSRSSKYLSSWCKLCWIEFGKERRKNEAYQEAMRGYQNSYNLRIREENPELHQVIKDKRADREREKLRQLRKTDPQGWRNYLDNANKRHQERWATDPSYRAREIARLQTRKAQKYQGGSFTEQEWLDLCELYGNRCLACGESKPLTVDHVVPLSKGGSNDISNIQPLCGSCNSSKRDKTIDYRPSKS